MQSNKRNKQVKFRVTERELEILNNSVAITKYSREEYLRLRSVYKKGIVVLPQTEFREIRKLLLSISNNINQIAYKAKIVGDVDAQRYKEKYDRLEEVVGWLLEIPLLIEEHANGTV